MAHYYDYDPTLSKEEHPVSFEIDGRTFSLLSSAGVFSSSKLDTGSAILGRTVCELHPSLGRTLDLGCGIGVLGVILAPYASSMTGIDVNDQACTLAAKNYEKYGLAGDILCQDHIDDKIYDTIVLNPPIRAGKSVIYSLFDQAYDHLREGGSLWIVIRKQHGAQSAMDHLSQAGFETQRVARDHGFWVIRAMKPSRSEA